MLRKLIYIYIFGKDIDVIAIKRGYHAEAHNEIF